MRETPPRCLSYDQGLLSITHSRSITSLNVKITLLLPISLIVNSLSVCHMGLKVRATKSTLMILWVKNFAARTCWSESSEKGPCPSFSVRESRSYKPLIASIGLLNVGWPRRLWEVLNPTYKWRTIRGKLKPYMETGTKFYWRLGFINREP